MGCQDTNKHLTQRLVELTTTEVHGEFYETGGEFLPLSVWSTMGYDPAAIAAKSLPKDKKMHPVLGETFRVCVLRKGHRGAKTVSKSDKLVATTSMAGSSGDNPGLGGARSPAGTRGQGGHVRLGLVFVFQPQEVERVRERREEVQEGGAYSQAEAVLLSAEGFVEFKLVLGF